MKANLFIYEMNPIDIWTGWIRLDDAMQNPEKYGIFYDFPSDQSNEDRKTQNLKQLQDFVERAKFLFAKHTSWEGDIRNQEAYISSVPNESECSLVFALKQDNNGTTFLASPIEYAHLKEFLVHTSREVQRTTSIFV